MVNKSLKPKVLKRLAKPSHNGASTRARASIHPSPAIIDPVISDPGQSGKFYRAKATNLPPKEPPLWIRECRKYLKYIYFLNWHAICNGTAATVRCAEKSEYKGRLPERKTKQGLRKWKTQYLCRYPIKWR